MKVSNIIKDDDNRMIGHKELKNREKLGKKTKKMRKTLKKKERRLLESDKSIS